MDDRTMGRAELLRRGMLGGVLLTGAGGVLAACGSESGGGATSGTAAATGGSGAAGATEAGGGSLAALRERGVVRFGFSGEKPYAYLDPEGNLVGSEADIARAAFKQVGVGQLDGVAMNFDSLIPAIQAGRIDTCFSIYVKPERCKILTYTTPHLAEGQGLIVKEGNPFDLHSFEDVKANGKARVGMTAGETTVDLARKVGISKSQITLFPNTQAEAAAIKAGRVDALILSSGSARTLIEQNADAGLERVADWTNPEIDGVRQVFYAAFPFLLKNAEIRDAVNPVIEDMRSSGKLLKITSRYGFGEADLPAADAPTLDAICYGPSLD